MTITWTKSAGELVDSALKRVQMLGAGQTASGHLWVVARDHLNGLIKLMTTQGPSQWRRATQTPAMTASVAFVTCSPRPDRVMKVWRRNSSSVDFELAQWNMDDYERIPNKAATGYPTIFAVDRQRTATTIYLWPTPNSTAAAETLRVSYERVPEDVTSPNDIIDVPQEWLDVVMDLVGGRTGESFGLSQQPPVASALSRGTSNLTEVLNYDRDPSVRFVFARE